jgi:tetratricopeptide (TPR) repeat protein
MPTKNNIHRSGFESLTGYLEAVCHFLRKFSNTWQDTCHELAEQALLELESEENLHPEMVEIMDQLAYQRWHKGNAEEALKILDLSDSYREKNGFLQKQSWGIMTRSVILWNKGEYLKAMEAIRIGLSKIKTTGEPQGILRWVMGVMYYDMKEYDLSIENYRRTLNECEWDEYLEFNCYAYTCIGLGCALKGKGEFSEASSYFIRALNKARENELWMEESRVLYEIGILESEMGKFESARNYLSESLSIRENNNNTFSSISNLLALGELSQKEGRLDDALLHYSKALLSAKDVSSAPKIELCHRKLSDLFKMKGDFQNALKHLELSNEISIQLKQELDSDKFKEARKIIL